MKKKLEILMLIFSNLSFNFLAAQNLVPNPSFEDTVSCPSGPGQINYAAGWSSYRNSPDYLNTCGAFSVSIPNNYWGTQMPHTGNAYAGEAIFHSLISNAREVLGIQLLQPLIIGEYYTGTFYVSMGVQNISYIGVAANKIGMKFSTVSFTSADPIPIDNNAKIFSDSIIADSTSWFQISGSFLADSAYEFISIGNFFDDSLTNTTAFDSAVYSYYYIDDVFVSHLDPENTNDLISENIIRLFPNPTFDWVTIEGKGINDVKIYDLFGKQFFPFIIIEENKIRMSTAILEKGIYILDIGDENIRIRKRLQKT